MPKLMKQFIQKFSLLTALLLGAALLAGCGNYSGSWTSPAAAVPPTNLAELAAPARDTPTPGPYIGTLPVAPLIVFTGSGIVQGSDLPARTAQLLAPQKYDYYNEGTAGQTTGQMLEAASWAIDFYYRPTRAKNILVVWAGQADLANGAPSGQVLASLISYCQAREAVGFKVVVMTLLPATPGPNDAANATYEAARQALNSGLRTNWPEFASALADVAALPVALPVPGAAVSGPANSAEAGWWAESLKTAITGLE